QARRLETIELIILLLQYQITRCTVQVQYFSSAPSNMRVRAVKPIHIQLAETENNESDEKPYWDDAIDKYFERPTNEIFTNITYPNYFRNYNLKSKRPTSNSRSYWTTDQKNRYVVQRRKPLLLRLANYRV